MTVARLPHEISPDLSPDRLSLVAQHMLSVLHEALEVAQTPDDCNYSRGTLSWARFRNRLLRLSQSGTYPWLRVMHGGADLVIGIGPHAVRFFLDDHLQPRKVRVFQPTEGEAVQLELGLPRVGTDEVALWRFFVEKARHEHDEPRVYFVGYNAFQEALAVWCYVDDVRGFYAADDFIPAAARLPPVEVEPLVLDERDGGEGTVGATGHAG